MRVRHYIQPAEVRGRPNALGAVLRETRRATQTVGQPSPGAIRRGLKRADWLYNITEAKTEVPHADGSKWPPGIASSCHTMRALFPFGRRLKEEQNEAEASRP